MPQEIKGINLGGVNCYLIKTGSGFILIDTGYSNKRARLQATLESAGCHAGNLQLIIITHGDSDHAANAAFLREKYGARIGMHYYDSGMVEFGDMSWNRKAKPDKLSLIFRIMLWLFARLARSIKFDTFKPDMLIDESFDLSAYGFQAKVLHLMGHSKGSTGVLTEGGELFCGDLFYNTPGLAYIDDMDDYRASMEKLMKLNIKMVYPGHGKPFSWSSRRIKYG